MLHTVLGCDKICSWEVLNGVGVDGVGGIFHFFLLFFVFLRFFDFFRFSSLFFAFLRFFFIFLRFSSFFFVFRLFVWNKRERLQFWEDGEFHSDPVCTDPVRNFPMQ